ncbi:toll/interleukin-1 receptor (TIR) domain-containing protein [Artemisia annua]|uniref:Toll/interleukin-1 receptor (TIR) domain-containing protein n=1 Tax=Artemisia annua TaxID=35608 RepID=A0A2U1PEV7_ARTAN|nr:toll/interleukin-1 receptor (TIR) domain-containing protein [Artemisia annua]
MALLSALVSKLLEELTSKVIEQVGLLWLWGRENDLSDLENTVKQTQGVLYEAEKKQTTQKHVEDWLRTLRSASLEAEKVIDKAKTEAMIQRMQGEMGWKNKVRRTFFNSHYNPQNMAHRVKNARKKLEDIVAYGSKFQLFPNTTSEDDAGIGAENSNRETSSLMSNLLWSERVGLPHKVKNARAEKYLKLIEENWHSRAWRIDGFGRYIYYIGELSWCIELREKLLRRNLCILDLGVYGNDYFFLRSSGTWIAHKVKNARKKFEVDKENGIRRGDDDVRVKKRFSFAIMLMLMLMLFIYCFYSMASSSNSSAPNSSVENSFKYDVFLSFRGVDTRKNFVGHLYEALKLKGIETYKDDETIEQGKRINDQLLKAIEESRFYIIVFSKNYASSSWCLNELVKIMECQKMTEHTAFPVFYGVQPTHVRKQNGPVGEAFSKHENQEAAGKWRDAMKELADLNGWDLANRDESKLIQKIVHHIFIKKYSTLSNADEKLVGMETRINDVLSSLEIGSEDVRMIGIKGIGGGGKTTLARAVYDRISTMFEEKTFVENVREVSQPSLSGLKELQKQILEDVLHKKDITFSGVQDGKNMLKATMRCRKMLVILDDVDHIEQLEALAGSSDWFKSGSRIIITTRDEQVLLAHGVSMNFVHDVNLLSHEEAICLFSRYAFRNEIPIQGYEELSGQVVQYADGLPLTIKVLGSFLCGKDKLEWQDAIDRLKKIPLKETQKKIQLSYISLEDEHKEIFLDIACILKGQHKQKAIRILESNGFHAIIGLKVLEQRSLITISKCGVLGMHDHIEEMGKNIVRREHPDEPHKHSRLWNTEEIEDILANDMGTEETKSIKLDMPRGNLRSLMKGLGKMKKLRYLEVNFAYYDTESDASQLDESTQYFPNSLKYLKCERYPFLNLPRTFQANNLVGLEMKCSRMVQFWEEGEKKNLQKLKFLSLSDSELTTFDFRITPNLEELYLENSDELEELCVPGCQKLKYLDVSDSKSITFDLGLTPNLETLSLFVCTRFVKLKVPVECPNLKYLNLRKSRLRSRSLDLQYSDELVETNAPFGCLKHLKGLYVTACCRLGKLPKDIGQSLVITDTGISHLPQSIFGLKGLLIIASSELLQLYNFPSEIETTHGSLSIRSHQRLIDILHPTAQTIDSLMQLELCAGVHVEVKL